MLEKCKSAMLISDVENFSEMYRQLALEADVEFTVEKSWKANYRVTSDTVILGSKHLADLNKVYYAIAVVILKPGESPVPYMKEGVSRFVFDHTNSFELFFAFFKPAKIVVHKESMEIKSILENCVGSSFTKGSYDFDFVKDIYRYKGKMLYLTRAQKKFLAEWLLHGHKDNSKRMIICNLRKKFGTDFMADIDRFGRIKEEKDE
jgi:hypothetical protein